MLNEALQLAMPANRGVTGVEVAATGWPHVTARGACDLEAAPTPLEGRDPMTC
jgi:hypothetical protein